MTFTANPGATTRDILEHIKPTLRKKPDVVIVHCGTNDLTSQEKTIENLQELIRMAKAESPDKELVMSSIIKKMGPLCFKFLRKFPQFYCKMLCIWNYLFQKSLRFVAKLQAYSLKFG